MGELHWPDLKELLADALEVQPADRAAYIARVCAGDDELRCQLEELLEYEGGDERVQRDEPEEAALGSVTDSSSEDKRNPRERWIGHYRLLEPIGEGGMGSVFKAQQRYPVKRFVAVKLIKPGYDTEEVIARFQSERQALARMDHPCIAKVFDAGVDERGRPYFVMEYVPGVPITRFADEAKLSIDQRLELFTQVCDAIAHAHTKAIIHRDLKPSNILACFADGQPVAKTIDFGIAKALTGDRLTDHTFDTSRGQPVGTYESMSPEQAAGSPDIDTRTDVYSLGVLLYELLSGTKPFDRTTFAGADDQERRRIIREVEPARPGSRLMALGADGAKIAAARGLGISALVRQLQSELEWIPLMAMRKEPARRYGGALELCADIRNYLENRPLVAGPEKKAYRLRKFAQRNRPALLTACAFAVVIGLAIGSYIRGIRLEQKKTQAALDLVQKKHDEVGKQRDEAQKQEQIAAAGNRFLSDMLETADPYRLFGDKVTVLQAMQAAVAQLDAGRMKDQPLVEAALRQTIGNTLRRLSRYADAEPNLRAALQLRRQALPAGHPEIAEALNDLGVLLRSQRKFSEGERVHREALKIRREKLPAGDPAIATSLTNLASVLQGQDRWWEAEPLYREALDIRRQALPAAHPDLAESVDNLAVILKNQKKIKAAEPLSREALEMRRTALPPGHPDLANSLQNLASLLRDQEKYADAEPLSRQAVAIFKMRLPADHPKVIISLIALAKSLTLQGKNADAEPLLREAIERLQRSIVAGRQTVQTDAGDLANNLHLLAQLLRDEGKIAEAKALLREALEVNRNAVPPDHWNLVKSLNELGALLQSEGELDEAEALFREVLHTCRMALSPEDPAIVKHYSVLMRLLKQRGKRQEAAALLREAVEINRKALPAHHPSLASRLTSLAKQERSEGNTAAAERLLREALDVSRRAYPAGDSATATIARQLADLLQRTNRGDEAVKIRKEYGLGSPSTAPATAPALPRANGE